MIPHTPAVNAAGELLPEQPKSVYSTTRSGLPSTWQPINTAPKDGTVVLLYAPTKWGSASDVFAGCWAHGEGLESCGVADADYPWLAFDPGTGGLNAYMDDRPTHWMPMPTAPESSAALATQGVQL